ncbi:phenoloxidase-activating factor 1-like isoform X2 [Maniola jurtina]|uniref:phenoloxidase-activating factor 1-like isoform X2 n=1 Tax=Maniola jurtina TaxID=191418 RepID=UPI001E68EE1D|nr:phenoloxidase-activating factor 1-like isoform X2 [Maniola jurtina]
MVLKCVVVLFMFVCIARSLKRGDPCQFNNTAGICKSINDCPFARKILYEDERKPPMCKWEDDLRIVCCPTRDVFHRTGIFKEYFFDSNHGIKRSKDMTCRYNGAQPLLCCRKTTDPEKSPEPSGCPELSRPLLNTDEQHYAWMKCLDYQQYFNKCVSKVNNPHEYTRVDTCGRDTFRIAGGAEANPMEFPHMAVLGCRNVVPTEEDVVWIGGGSLISEKYILTAAHVLMSPTHGVIKFALLGTVNKTDTRNGALYNIVRRIPYPTYQASSLNYDIALVELERRVRFSEFIRPACLPVPGREIESDRIIAGWGETGFRARSELLLTGDSGGPLMALMKNIKCSYSIEGIVSRGPRDCGQGYPGVYTRVTHYLPWILDNVWPELQRKNGENTFQIFKK